MATNVEGAPFSDAAASDPTRRITHMQGIDSIRYVCAIWVVLNHLYESAHSSAFDHGLGKLVGAILGAAFSGPAAVIVFFVISGLCIHFPYRHGEKLDYFSYYMRRYLRVGIPMVIVIVLVQLLAGQRPHLVTIAFINNNSVMWSLIAELIYYTAYPALMLAQRKVGWGYLIGASFLSAYVVVFSHPHIAAQGGYPLFGWKLNWIVGLPCWLLGCRLAAYLPHAKIGVGGVAADRTNIWVWRMGIWFLSCISKFLQFHQHQKPIHFGYSITLDLFAVAVYFWLIKEISYAQVNPPIRWLENAGAASYSLYLVHPIVLSFAFDHHMFYNMLTTVAVLLAIILVSTLFYYVVERPSHLLARKFRPTRKREIISANL